MKPASKIQGRYERMTERAAGVRLPFLSDDPSLAPVSAAPRVVRVAPRQSEPTSGQPGEMTQVIFGSFAPAAQPAMDWLGTPSGGKLLATGGIALGALAITRLLRS